MFSLLRKTSIIKLIVLLFVIGFVTYASSFQNQFVWDDDHFFHQNIFTQNLSHLREIFTSNTTAGAGVSSNYYRPITTVTFAIDHLIWGWNPIGLHFTNTLFHVVNGILLLLLLIRLQFGKLGSFLLTIIFLIHPIQTEAVTYLSSRGDVFYTFFLLLSLHLFTITLYKRSLTILISSKSIHLSQTFLLFLSIILFLLSILSKEGALTTVPIYAGIFWIFALQKKLSLRELHKRYRNHFIALMLLVWITLVYFGMRLTILNFGSSLNYSGDQSAYATHLSLRLFTFLKTLVIYLYLLIIPYPLYLERSTSIVTSVLNPWVLGSIGMIATTISLGIIELKRKHTCWIFFALIIIFSNLLSVSGIIPMTGLLRENWLYMPMIGFYLIIFVVGKMFFLPYLEKREKLFAIIFLLYCLILISMTIQQNSHWKNKIAYFEHNLRFTNTARLHLNLGNAYIGKGDQDKALAHLRKAAQIEDNYPQTHYNIANIYVQKGKFDLAEKELLISLAIDPDYLYAYPVLLSIYEHQNQPEKSLPYLKRLNAIYPNDLKLTLTFAKNLYSAKQYDEAEKQFKKAIRLSRNDPKLIKAINDTKK